MISLLWTWSYNISCEFATANKYLNKMRLPFDPIQQFHLPHQLHKEDIYVFLPKATEVCETFIQQCTTVHLSSWIHLTLKSGTSDYHVSPYISTESSANSLKCFSVFQTCKPILSGSISHVTLYLKLNSDLGATKLEMFY